MQAGGESGAEGIRGSGTKWAAVGSGGMLCGMVYIQATVKVVCVFLSMLPSSKPSMVEWRWGGVGCGMCFSKQELHVGACRYG